MGVSGGERWIIGFDVGMVGCNCVLCRGQGWMNGWDRGSEGGGYVHLWVGNGEGGVGAAVLMGFGMR